jgi:ubiquinone/menaquinone biosynthesis C-methylase UbiE
LNTNSILDSSEQVKVQAAYQGAAVVYNNSQIGDYQRASAYHLLADIYPHPASGSRVLDLGCGTGIALFVLRELYPQIGPVVGLDLSVEMLEQAQAKNGAEAIGWIQSHAQTLPFDANAFDLIISHNAFHWFPDRVQALQEIKRVLKPGGRMAFLFEGHGARHYSLDIRREVLKRYGLKAPPGFGYATDETGEGWNSLLGVEKLITEAGLNILDLWGRESYIYLPVEILMNQFEATIGYWGSDLSQEKINLVLDEMRRELQALETPRGFREVLYPVNVIAQKAL